MSARFSRHVATTFSTQVLQIGLGLVTTMVLVRALGPAGKGACDLAVLVPSMLALLLSAGLGIANVYHAGSRRFAVGQLSSNSIGWGLLAGTAGIGLYALAAATGVLAKLVPGVPPSLVVPAALLLPCGVLFPALTGILQGRGRITQVNLLTGGQALFTLAGALLFVVALGLGARGAVFATVLGAGAALLLALPLVRRDGGSLRPARDRTVLRTSLAFGLRGHIGNLLQLMNYRLDVFLVNAFLDPARVGLYGVAVRLAETLWLLPSAIAFVLFTRVASAGRSGDDTLTKRSLWIALAAGALGAIVLIVIGRPLLRLLFSEAFVPSYGALVALLPGVVLLGGAKILANDIAGRGYPHLNSIGSGLALAFTIVLDLVLIPRHGIVGAAAASSIAYAVGFAYSLWAFARIRRAGRTGERTMEIDPR